MTVHPNETGGGADVERAAYALLEEAIGLPVEQRIAFVRERATDPAIRERARELVEEQLAHSAEGSRDIVPEPPGRRPRAAEFPNEQPPTSIGPYKIVEQIGEGGYGIVYLAEQTEPRRRVALKVIKWGMDTKQVLARFEVERQALALLDHPNIAKVFDAGATVGGHPFFVMEHVDGVAITDHCNMRESPIRERLELFLQVCAAIQHAHQKGVIHRDLKPSNILVSVKDEEPVVKIIDFGVAKASQQRLTEATVLTEHGQIIGTLEYMSPEQANGSAEEADTRSDIYSLGVLLYELLVGRLPFDRKELRGAAELEMRRIICEDEPQRPSTRLADLGSAANEVVRQRSTDYRDLLSRLQGDLDWVVLRCLEKNRSRRYATASELGSEIDRFLTNQPVIAHPPGLAYRARKFTRRNLRTVLAAALMLVLAIALLAAWRSSLARRLDADRLASLTARIVSGVEISARDKSYTGLMNRLVNRIRAGTISTNEAENLVGLLLDIDIPSRSFVPPDADWPVARIDVEARYALWPKDLAILVDIAVSENVERDRHGRWGMGYLHDNDSFSTVSFGVGVLQTAATRTRGVHPWHATINVTLRAGDQKTNCTIPLRPMLFTVADGIGDGLVEITDPELVAIAHERVVVTGLEWHDPDRKQPVRRRPGRWRVRIKSSPELAHLALELSLLDGHGTILGTCDLLVHRADDVGTSTPERSLAIDPPVGLPRDAIGRPLFANPVTVRLRSSRRVALSDPKVQAFMQFDFRESMSVELDPPQ